MSQYSVADKVTLAQVIDAAKDENGVVTKTASFFIEDGGVKFVVSITPAALVAAKLKEV